MRLTGKFPVMPAKSKTILGWIFRVAAAVIMLQTLFFKFTASEESVYIFSKLGIEPWGRIGTGIMELVASVLILIPRTKAVGALLAVGIMAGAIISHVLFLGIVVQNDGGLLFGYACLVFVSALAVLLFYWRELLQFVPARFTPAKF